MQARCMSERTASGFGDAYDELMEGSRILTSRLEGYDTQLSPYHDVELVVVYMGYGRNFVNCSRSTIWKVISIQVKKKLKLDVVNVPPS